MRNMNGNVEPKTAVFLQQIEETKFQQESNSKRKEGENREDWTGRAGPQMISCSLMTILFCSCCQCFLFLQDLHWQNSSQKQLLQNFNLSESQLLGWFHKHILHQIGVKIKIYFALLVFVHQTVSQSFLCLRAQRPVGIHINWLV